MVAIGSPTIREPEAWWEGYDVGRRVPAQQTKFADTCVSDKLSQVTVGGEPLY